MKEELLKCCFIFFAELVEYVDIDKSINSIERLHRLVGISFIIAGREVLLRLAAGKL